ncbi:MAG: hypothetical protein JSW53_04415 [Candidatus Bathyarchaeota archaeon]|nr:MAG: hypothetical protein JSW53_04415 [Candidatus Bathyarchaeota archaeon]
MSDQVTCSAIVSFAQRLEEASSKFYEELAGKYAEGRETFLVFARECIKNKVLVTRTYQETISDALEACFIQMDLSNYPSEIALNEGQSYQVALEAAIKLEENAGRFYSDAAEQSKSLLATIPRAFKRAAERRNGRRARLKTILDKSK